MGQKKAEIPEFSGLFSMLVLLGYSRPDRRCHSTFNKRHHCVTVTVTVTGYLCVRLSWAYSSYVFYAVGVILHTQGPLLNVP
jgi:hypothetical protein